MFYDVDDVIAYKGGFWRVTEAVKDGQKVLYTLINDDETIYIYEDDLLCGNA